MTTKYTPRSIKTYFNFKNILPYFIYFLRCFKIFKNPLLFIYSYLFYNNLSYVKLRNGLTLYLSDHPHDCVTIFTVFVRRDYGKIAKNSVVLDVGGNIGIFALYALNSGSSHIYIVEPNSRSINLINKNLEFNNFSNKATIIRSAVTSQSNQLLKIPIESSMYNKISASNKVNNNESFEEVNSISLEELYEKYEGINFTKMDCEGSEYDIILNSPKRILEKVPKYIIEFHQGNVIKLIEKFASVGIKPSASKVRDLLKEEIGILDVQKCE
jgi:FkbM family methyltransferase